MGVNASRWQPILKSSFIRLSATVITSFYMLKPLSIWCWVTQHASITYSSHLKTSSWGTSESYREQTSRLNVTRFSGLWTALKWWDTSCCWCAVSWEAFSYLKFMVVFQPLLILFASTPHRQYDIYFSECILKYNLQLFLFHRWNLCWNIRTNWKNMEHGPGNICPDLTWCNF